jgi:glutathione S-transferase
MMRLYHCVGARSMRSLWLLYEMGVEFELETLEFSMESLRTPDYLSVSPLGRVPCLVDKEVKLFESGAICQYLCEHYDDGRLYRAPGSRDRIKWLQWIHYAETIAVHGAALVQQKVFIAPEKRSDVVQKLESRRLFLSIKMLEPILSEQKYLLGDSFTAVDTGIGYSIHLAKQFIDTSALTAVDAYYERLISRDAFQRAL